MPPDAAPSRILRAETILPAGKTFDATLRFFIDELGFRLDSIAPADRPVRAQLSGHGLHLCLDAAHRGEPGNLRLFLSDEPTREALTAPNGTRIEFAALDPPLVVPKTKVTPRIDRFTDDKGSWNTGRAGMLYRDLIPDRLGGYLIASHIRIPDGGPVPDEVHHHAIAFQFIYCCKGWVRLVYEDQGEPFVMHAGDCVLQPPHIRHRVLEASAELEVVELACPAEHVTSLDHDMTLPTGRHLPERDYGGQTFVFHQADKAEWKLLAETGFEVRDLGLKKAIRGLVQAQVLHPSVTRAPEAATELQAQGAFMFLFVLSGSAQIASVGATETELGPGGVCVAPGHARIDFRQCSSNFELLSVECPG
ncbi:MAG: cupin domain-containing protein [Gammaproteobacteria bacterium]